MLVKELKRRILELQSDMEFVETIEGNLIGFADERIMFTVPLYEKGDYQLSDYYPLSGMKREWVAEILTHFVESPLISRTVSGANIVRLLQDELRYYVHIHLGHSIVVQPIEVDDVLTKIIVQVSVDGFNVVLRYEIKATGLESYVSPDYLELNEKLIKTISAYVTYMAELEQKNQGGPYVNE